MSKIISSPLLHVADFVGPDRKADVRHPQEGKPWLWCHEYGFSFCVEQIADRFKPLEHGAIARVHATLEPGFYPDRHWEQFEIDEALLISELADRMLFHLFGVDGIDRTFERAVLQHLGYDPDDDDCPGFEDVDLGPIYYRVVQV